MAQTQALMYSAGGAVDYTPASAVAAGDVVVIGTTPMIASVAIAADAKGSLTCEGVWKVPKTTDTFSAGDAVYWDADGTPVTGDASSGAADSSASTGYLMGYATAAALTGDSYVYVQLRSAVFGAAPRIPTATVAATGTVQADAAQLAEGFTLVTGADDAKGVKLPAAVAGAQVTIKVDAGADLKVWPSTGDAINAIAANSAMTVVDDVCFTLIALDGTTWYTLPLLPS